MISWSRAVAAKECLQTGHTVAVLERSQLHGGVQCNRACKTMLTSSNMNTSLSDFVFPELFVDNPRVGFATGDQFLSHLDDCVAHFKVDRAMSCECEVVEACKGKVMLSCGIRWTVKAMRCQPK
jgi:cation diffusion facilitator CzcD-associated flavoprotein CzcO